jgi:hypothetical protein
MPDFADVLRLEACVSLWLILAALVVLMAVVLMAVVLMAVVLMAVVLMAVVPVAVVPVAVVLIGEIVLVTGKFVVWRLSEFGVPCTCQILL